MGTGPRYRWVVLVVGTGAQAATATYILGLASVTPALRAHFGLGIAEVGVLLGGISIGLVATLIAWGSAADRFGERVVMSVGLLGAAAAWGLRCPRTTPSWQVGCWSWRERSGRASTQRVGVPC